MALTGDDQLRFVLFAVGAAAVILISFTAAWFWSERFCSCCRRVKPVGRPRKEVDPEAGIELVDNTNKDANQKSEEDKTRDRATGTVYPQNEQYSMAAAGSGAGHQNPLPAELAFDADDLRESEEAHPHEVKKTAPTPPKSRIPKRTSRQATDGEFENVDLNSDHVVKPKEMV
jgi:hypothetical protein